MFTPPPSPRPSEPKQVVALQVNASSHSLSPSTTIPHAMSSHDRKRRTGRQFRWAVLIVPLILVLIGASSRYLTHPAAFDVFASPSSEWSQLLANGKDWRLHKRHPSPEPDDGSPPPSLTVSGNPPALSPSTTIVVQQPVPTMPSAPPILPTPFPQPFDGTQLTLNFSSTTCLSFFTNMTQSAAFRPCRAFSLLSQSSYTFINAQSNLTLMNTLIWGTCNTNPGINQCIANIGWFAESLGGQCEQDLKDRNALAVDTLTALNAYKLMHDAACTPNPTTNTYCYLDAVAEPKPADLYLYQLPLGTNLPSRTTGLTCSPCSRSVLGLYASALGNETQADGLTGLKDAYESSVQIVNTACGPDFAKTGLVNGAATIVSPHGLMGIVAVVLGIWTLAI